MPIHEFKCESDHVSEKLFLTFGDAEGVEEIPCPQITGYAATGTEKIQSIIRCGKPARKIVSVPLPAHFYGDGWYKPSPTGRYNTKVVSKKEGNASSIG